MFTIIIQLGAEGGTEGAEGRAGAGEECRIKGDGRKLRKKGGEEKKKKRPVQDGEKKWEIVYGRRKDQRVKRNMRLRKRERQRRKGKEPGVIYASLGTRLYLFFSPASCFTSAI